ncbi:hypothetical protein IV203_026711 [Nitzschia inconspicua]|uniref:Uncharacterized protein n=1 Tax=Nitzschia inconspicua TaxID=303405 RepID=A0A9K3LM73_9STRA|nr:hypothetical protein IV203_026711 [Nitzschia inconspicua]
MSIEYRNDLQQSSLEENLFYSEQDDNIDEDESDEFEDDISESLEYMAPMNGVDLMSPRSGGTGNSSVLSNDDSYLSGVSPGVGLAARDNHHSHYANRNHNPRGQYFNRNSGDTTPMVTNRAYRIEQTFHQEEKGDPDDETHNLQDSKNAEENSIKANHQLFPSRLPVYGDSSDEEGDTTLEDEEGSISLRDQEHPPSPYQKFPSSRSPSGSTSFDSPRRSRRNVSIGDSDASRSPSTPRLSQQQELQRQRLNHLMMTPAGILRPDEITLDEQQKKQSLNHLMMTPTMSEPSRDHTRSGMTDPESSVSFASPVTSHSQAQQLQMQQQQPQPLDLLPRSSNHTRESATTQSGTIQSETTRYHSGVEREFRKEAFRRNNSTPDRDAEEVDRVSSDGSESTLEPLKLCGITCSMGFTRLVNNPCSLYRISLCIVAYAPCFWFSCCNKSELQGSASSDRFILGRLNTISFFFTMMQLVAAAWLATVLFWITGEGATGAFSPHLWNCNGAAFSVGLIGAVIMVMCFCTVRIIKEVDLVGAIRYLWSLLWIFPVELFFNITLFDYHQVTEVWVVHWWGNRQFSWLRDRYCLEGTADTLCVVPIDGGPDYDTEDDWCQSLYNSSECTAIRDDAQKDASFWLLIFYTSLAIWGCIFMFLMLLVINTLERIISKPIVQKSRETNVPGWLTFPTVATALVGTVFLFAPSSLLRTLKEQQWVGLLYTVTSALFFIALLMGCCLSSFSIRSNADKRRKGSGVIIFIGVLAVNASLLATLFVTSIVWSSKVQLNNSQRGDIACLIDDNDCTNCDAALSADKCPEWSVEDVTSILQTQLKQSASLAAIFILYAVNVMSYGVNLRKHLSQYQIDYV